MNLTTFTGRMGRNDARLVSRDRLLITILIYPVMTLLLARFGLPPLAEWLLRDVDFDLYPYFPLIIGYAFGAITPLLFGVIIGMLLIEEQDDRTLTALMVTPVSLTNFVRYRITTAYVLTFGMLGISLLVMNPYLGLNVGVLLLITAVASLSAPFTTLVFFALSANKIQAFAVMKGISLVNVTIVAAWFVGDPWSILFGFFPPYWAIKGLWVALESGPYWLHLLAGVVTSAIGIWLLIRRFQRKAYAGIEG